MIAGALWMTGPDRQPHVNDTVAVAINGMASA
jgi:hypothetical protein